MASGQDILKDIPDAKPVRIFLPILGSRERFRAQCVYQKDSGSHFNLLFQRGTLPIDSIDASEPCLVSIDMGGPNVSLEAMIAKVSGNQVLEMVVKKSISHDQMREFFRVDATAKVISRSFHPEFFGKQGEPWSVQGKTVDISGSGILASFPENPPMDDQIRLEITLPTTPPEVVKVLAHPVRSMQIAENQWDVAYHFDDIATEDRDKIIGCCLVLQRRLLRLKVQVRDHAKS